MREFEVSVRVQIEDAGDQEDPDIDGATRIAAIDAAMYELMAWAMGDDDVADPYVKELIP